MSVFVSSEDQSDPRVEAAAKALFEIAGSRSGSDGPRAGHRLRARQIIASIDSADRAAGIRRVTEQEFGADKLRAALRAFVSDTKECDDGEDGCRLCVADELLLLLRVRGGGA